MLIVYNSLSAKYISYEVDQSIYASRINHQKIRANQTLLLVQ